MSHPDRSLSLASFRAGRRGSRPPSGADGGTGCAARVPSSSPRARRNRTGAAAALAAALAAPGCTGPHPEGAGWRPLASLHVTGKTAGEERVSVLDFCQPERVRPVLARLQRDWPPGLSSAQRAERLLAFVQALPESSDPDDVWQMPGETLIAGGDCEDRTFLLVSLLAADELAAWVMVGTYHDRPHTWAAVELPGQGLRYLETLDRGGRLRRPSGAYAPWGRWNAAGRIEEWSAQAAAVARPEPGE